jgi:hypothetical protein
LAPSFRVLVLDGVMDLSDRRFAFSFRYINTQDIMDDTEFTPRFLVSPNKSFTVFRLRVGTDTAFERQNVDNIHPTRLQVFILLGSYESNFTQTLEPSRFLHALFPHSDLRGLILGLYTQFPLDLATSSDLLCACPRLQARTMWHGEEGLRT